MYFKICKNLFDMKCIFQTVVIFCFSYYDLDRIKKEKKTSILIKNEK